MKKIYFSIVLFWGLVNNTNAQTNNLQQFFIYKIDSICNNITTEIPVKVKNFKNVVGFQGSINWDTAVVKFDTIIPSPIPNFKPVDFYKNLQKNSGFVAFLWVDTLGNKSITVPDSTTIFTLRLKVVNPNTFSNPISFSDFPTLRSIDTAADLTMLSDLATIEDTTLWQSGYLKFVDTPKISQNGNVFTLTASCNPIMYIWTTFDCNNNVISVDTTYTNIFVSPLPDSTCYSVACAARYTNGLRISSVRTLNILPLKFISFIINQTEKNIQLNWQTTNETNVSHFNIQRSFDKKEFNNIGKINAGKKQYNFSENSRPSSVNSRLFYRLEIIDIDGSKTYSDIKTLILKPQFSNFVIYPNPAKSNVTIEVNNVNEIVIVDYLGIEIKKQIFNTQLSIFNLQLNKGIYFVKATMNNGETKVEKLIVE